MMPAQRDQIRARLDAATPGPWVDCTDTLGYVVSVGPYHPIAREPEHDERIPDMTLIAHAPADIRALLDEVEQLSTALEEEQRRSRRWKASAKKWRYLFHNEHRLASAWGNDLGLVNNLLRRLGLWRTDITPTWRRVEAALNTVKEKTTP